MTNTKLPQFRKSNKHSLTSHDYLSMVVLRLLLISLLCHQTIFMRKVLIIVIISFSANLIAQDFGDFPTIEKNKHLRDLDLLYQGLDKFHTGMYWYTSNDSLKVAFQKARGQITTGKAAIWTPLII